MIVGLIPARSGSKGVPDKNIRPLAGYPLMAWSIAASLMSELIEDTVVSTDSIEYAGIAADYGAKVLMRPPELATDEAEDIGYIRHAFKEIKVDYLVILRPTTPLRECKVIEGAINYYLKCKDGDPLRSMHETREPVYKCMKLSGAHALSINGRWVSANQPRQKFLPTYQPNGYVDIWKPEVRSDFIVRHFITLEVPEIDREEDFDYIEWRIEKYGSEILEYLRKART